MGSLTADELEAAQVVHTCQQKLDAAREQLETVWEEVLQQVVQMEFVSSLADAVKARNTLALVEATLRFNATGNTVTPLVQRLVFQASVLEEALLVRQSIMQAVLEGKFDDIELWAEQAQTLGEDLHLELAYADRLRQASQQTSKSSSSSWSTSSPDDDAAGDHGRGTTGREEHCKDTSKHSWDCSTTRPHSPQSVEPTPRPEPPEPAVEPEPKRRDPAPYSASGVQLKHAKWRADERPADGPFPESKRCFPESASFPRFTEYEQRRTKERRSPEADWDYLQAKAEQQRYAAFQPTKGPRPGQRPASAPARGREPREPAGAGRAAAHAAHAAGAQRTATRAKAQSLFGSWWKSWMGAAKDPPSRDVPRGDRADRGERRSRPREEKGRLLVSKVECRESDLMILGFARNAKPTPEELKKAYKVMAMRWHPDRPHNRDKNSEATANFRTVKAAYDHLTRSLPPAVR